jgi:hypothetical protein
MKRFTLVLMLLVPSFVFADAIGDQLTFSFIELNAPVVNLTSTAAGVVAGPALNIVVSDTLHHEQFPLSGFFNATTGAATSITSNSDVYEGEYGSGGSVSIVGGGITFVAGSPMFDHSHLVSHRAEDEGAFAGEFHVTSVDPSVFALFGLPDKWNPDGSVSVTFGHSTVTGNNLSGVIGGGTVTIETPAPIPEPSTWLMLAFGIGTCCIAWQARKWAARNP